MWRANNWDKMSKKENKFEGDFFYFLPPKTKNKGEGS
jgi:hypothetical protein